MAHEEHVPLLCVEQQQVCNTMPTNQQDENSQMSTQLVGTASVGSIPFHLLQDHIPVPGRRREHWWPVQLQSFQNPADFVTFLEDFLMRGKREGSNHTLVTLHRFVAQSLVIEQVCQEFADIGLRRRMWDNVMSYAVTFPHTPLLGVTNSGFSSPGVGMSSSGGVVEIRVLWTLE